MININRLSIEDARLIIEGSRNKAFEINVAMCIAVADESGNLIAFERMNGGKAHSIVIAQDKAFTAGAAQKATHEYNKANIPGKLTFGVHTEYGGRISSVGGGIPVQINEEFVGAVGASSGTPEQDILVAQAGVDYFLANR